MSINHRIECECDSCLERWTQEQNGPNKIGAFKRILDDLAQTRKELAEWLTDYVRQECYVKDGEYDSFATHSKAEAMRRLAELGKFVIDKECGRRVIGHFKNDREGK